MGHESRPQETTSKEAIGPRVGVLTAWRAVVLAFFIVAGSSRPCRAQSPAEVFLENCARCHGETGKADVPVSRTLKVAPLVNDASARTRSTRRSSSCATSIWSPPRCT